ncbi:MAG TPA: helix-turn-helix domain-containing protein [Hanamia sp.]
MQAVTITQITAPELQELIESSLKKILNSKAKEPQPETDQWFDLSELCEYLPDKPAKATVYGYVSANAIPCHKGAKKLRFLKSEIDNWLKSGKKKTISEINADANDYLTNKKGGCNA